MTLWWGNVRTVYFVAHCHVDPYLTVCGRLSEDECGGEARVADADGGLLLFVCDAVSVCYRCD